MTLFSSHRPTILVDSSLRIFFYGSSVFDWLAQSEQQFYAVTSALLLPSLSSKELEKACKAGSRGKHFPSIMGHHRQYNKVRSIFFSLNTYWVSCWTRSQYLPNGIGIIMKKWKSTLVTLSFKKSCKFIYFSWSPLKLNIISEHMFPPLLGLFFQG